MTRLGITGHRQASPEVWSSVRAELDVVVAEAAPAPVCVTSLAAGADQLLAELVLASGGRLHVIIPCADYASTFDRPAVAERYRELLEAADVRDSLPFPGPTEEAFYAAGKRVVDASDLLIAVWDGQPARGLGGTADVVAYAQARRHPVRVVWPVGEPHG